MDRLKLGMKIYSYDWYWKYGLSYAEAAALLRAQGVDFVISQNQYIPSMNTAAKAEVPPEFLGRFKDYDDIRFRAALKDAGIEYWVSALMFFNPPETIRFGNIPVDANGRKSVKEDWYIGACPSSDAYVEHRLQQICSAVDALEPDGVFLGFMRFPGFWETWLPDTRPEDWTEYCFCSDCVRKFARWRQALPESVCGNGTGAWIKKKFAGEYSVWKAHRLREIILELKRRMGNGVRVMLNTLPFDRKNYGDVRAGIFGQDIEILGDAVDVFEIMAYHQILARPDSWVQEAVEDVYDVLQDNSRVFCTIQGKPDYLTGIHAGRGRSPDVSQDEVETIISGVKHGGKAGGVIVYSWADFLERRFIGGSDAYIEAIKRCL